MNAETRLDRVIGVPEWSPAPVDFSRDVVCVLGLPFDVVSMDGAVAQVQEAASSRRRLMVSTANLNFVVAAQSQPKFRLSVVHSDLSLADGMPIVWMAKLMGLEVPERVPGAGLFERLWAARTQRQMRVFFFGAPPGVAEAAAKRVNEQGGGVVCVGFDPAGFGSVESMSSPELLHRINSCRPDFVVVSLGAQKGQAWIERNRGLLEAPVISHLGAVVGFAAGALARAPAWVQAMGLEWLWRIKEEPHLWRRYAKDAVALSKLLLQSVLPLCWDRWLGASGRSMAATLHVQPDVDECLLTVEGWLGRKDLAQLRPALQMAVDAATRVTVDVSRLNGLDAYAMAQFLLLSGHMDDAGLPLVFRGAAPELRRLFRAHCTEHLLATAPAEAADSGMLTGIRTT